MALLTPLNVNCHASDGRKVRAFTASTAVISAPQGDQSGFQRTQAGFLGLFGT